MENFNNVPSTGKFGESIAVVNENFLLAQQKMEELQALYNALQQTEPEIIEPSDTWPVANPEEGVIYRVIDRVNTPPQYYSDYMWNGTSMVQMARYNNAIDDEPTPGSNNLVKSGGVAANIVYDISAAHSGTTYADLASALGTNGANVPVAVSKGGMSVKFVQSSDNQYVQYRLLSESFNTNIGNWQILDNKTMFATAYSDKKVIEFEKGDRIKNISIKGKYYDNRKTGLNIVELSDNLYGGFLFVQGNVIRRFREGSDSVNIPFNVPITFQQGVTYYVSIGNAKVTSCYLGTEQSSAAYNMYASSVKIVGDGTTYTRFRVGLSATDLVDNVLEFSISTTEMSAFEGYVGGTAIPTPINPSELKNNYGAIISNLLGYTGSYQNYCPQFIQGNISSVTGDYEEDSTFVCTNDYIPVIGENYYIKRSVRTSYFRIRCYDKNKSFLPNNEDNYEIIGSLEASDRFVALTFSSNVKFFKITDRSNDLTTNYYVSPFPNIPFTEIEHSTFLHSIKIGEHNIYGLPYSQDILNVKDDGKASIVHNNAIVKLNTLTWESIGNNIYKTSSLGLLRTRRNGNINATHYSVSDATPDSLDNYNITALDDGYIYIKDSRFNDDVSAFVSALSDSNVLLYERSESILENLTEDIDFNGVVLDNNRNIMSINNYCFYQALMYEGNIKFSDITVRDNYATVEKLKEDITAAAGMVCKTLGYAEPNDGGAASYVISDTPSSVSILLNNGLYANMAYDNGVVKAEQIGILPGSKENGLNLQKFIDNNLGGEIHFGNKVYEFNSEIVFPQDGYIKLIGHGYPDLVYNGTGIFISAYGRMVVIKNLRIGNKNVRNSAIGIRLGYLDANNPSNNKYIMNSRIEDVYMWGFDIDMECNWAWKMNISNVFLQGANIGLKINDMLSSVFINLNLEHDIYGGIIVMADGVSFYTPCIEGNSNLSIDIQGGIDITIYDAYFETSAAGIKTSDDANVTIYSMFTCYPSLYQFGKNTKVIRPKGYGGFLKCGSRKIKEAPTYHRAPLNLTSIDAKFITEWFNKKSFDESFVYDEGNNLWESSDDNYKLGGFANNPSESLPDFSFSDGTGVISLKVWVKNDLIPESGRVVFDFELEQTLVESDRCFVNIGSVSEQTYNYDRTGLGNHHDAIYNENRLQYWFDFIKNELTTEGGYSLFEIGLYHNDSSAFTAEIKGIALFDDVLEL